jgi:hypothetical protein
MTSHREVVNLINDLVLQVLIVGNDNTRFPIGLDPITE